MCIRDRCGDVVYRNSVMEKVDDILDELEKIVSKVSIIDYSKVA